MPKKSLNAKKLKALRKIARGAIMGNDTDAKVLNEQYTIKQASRALDVASRSASLRRKLPNLEKA